MQIIIESVEAEIFTVDLHPRIEPVQTVEARELLG